MIRGLNRPGLLRLCTELPYVNTKMAERTEYVHTRADLEELCGLTKSAISQHIARGNLIPGDLVSVAAFLARYGVEEVRLEIVKKMVGIDRQVIERSRPQSTRGWGRDEEGRLLRDSPKARIRVKRQADSTEAGDD